MKNVFLFKIEVFHGAFHKRTLKLCKMTIIVMIYYETDTQSLQMLIEKRLTGYYLRFITSQLTKLKFMLEYSQIRVE